MDFKWSSPFCLDCKVHLYCEKLNFIGGAAPQTKLNHVLCTISKIINTSLKNNKSISVRDLRKFSRLKFMFGGLQLASTAMPEANALEKQKVNILVG